MKGGQDRAYARAVAGVLARLLGRSSVLSPRDFALLAGWRAKGVPLATVLEALERAGRRSNFGARSPLTQVAPAVEEAWQALREARAPSLGGPATGGPSLASERARWLSALARSGPGTPLGELLAALLARLDAGEDPTHVDRDLDRDLVAAASEELRCLARAEVERRLAEVRAKLGRQVELPAIERAVLDALRVRLDLPRLALSERAAAADPNSL